MIRWLILPSPGLNKMIYCSITGPAVIFLLMLISCSKDNMVSTTPVTPPAVKKFDILVGSRNNHSVKLYDGDSGTYKGDFIPSGTGGLNTTQDLLFLPDGSLLVTGLNNNTIKRYNGDSGSYIGDFTSGYSLVKPTKMSIGPDSLIYVSQWGQVQNKVARFTLQGNFVDEFTSIGIPNGLDHAWDSDGNFYVAAYGSGTNGKIYKFTAAGVYIGIFIDSGNLEGPSGIWFNSSHDFFCADWTLGKVQHFSSSGAFIDTYISGMVNIEGFATEPDKSLLLCDWTLNKVNKYDSLGVLISAFITTGGLASPNSIALKFK